MFDGFLLHLYQSMLILKRGTQHPLQWESQLSHLVGHQLLQSCWAKVRGFQGCITMETSTFSHSIGFPGKCSLYSILWVWKNGISLGNCKSFGNNHCQKWGNDGKLDRVYYLSWDHRHRLLLWQARGSLPNRPPSSLDEYPPCPFLRLDPWTSVSAGLPLAGIQVADVPSLRSLPEELWENHQIHRFNVTLLVKMAWKARANPPFSDPNLPWFWCPSFPGALSFASGTFCSFPSPPGGLQIGNHL